MKESAFLVAMDRIVDGVQIQHDLFGRRLAAAMNASTIHRSIASGSMTIFLYRSWAPTVAPVNSNRFNVHLPASDFPRSRACRRSSPSGSALSTATATQAA